MNTETRTFRSRRFPGYFLYGLGAFFALMCALMLLAGLLPAKGDARATILVFAVPFGLIALWMFRFGQRLVRATVELTPDQLVLRTYEFRVWGLRPFRKVALSWDQVVAVDILETPNPYAPGGVQRDYVLHTSIGRYAVANVLFPDAEQIAVAIADQIGRAVGDTAGVAQPVTLDRGRDRLGIKAMRALGWVSITCGAIFLVCTALVLFSGKPEALSIAARVGMMSGVLFTCGAALKRFEFRQPGLAGKASKS